MKDVILKKFLKDSLVESVALLLGITFIDKSRGCSMDRILSTSPLRPKGALSSAINCHLFYVPVRCHTGTEFRVLWLYIYLVSYSL